MKRFLSLLLIFSLVLLASCGSESTSSSAEESKEASAEVSFTEESKADVSASVESSEESSEEVSEDRTIDRNGSKVLVSDGCKYTGSGSQHYLYSDDGTKLTDGKFGGDVGAGWETNRGVFVVDLGEKTKGLADFTVMSAVQPDWGIVGPDTAVYSVSDDKKNWTEVGTVSGDAIVEEISWGGWTNYYFPLELEESVSGRYVRVVLTGDGMNYAWLHEIGVWVYEKDENRELHDFTGTEEITNLTFANRDDNSMGDMYAPGYCVYSKTGFNKGEMSFEMSQVDVNNWGSKKGHVTCYVFLGISVNNDGGWWMNCCDAGFTYDNETSGWHLFYATATDENGVRGWYSNTKTLNSKHDYKLVLDSSKQDGKVTMTAIDLADGKVADTLEFDLWGSKADGSNTLYLTDIAIDWADENTLVDTKGNPTTEDNWVEITKANMGQGIHMNNVRLYDIALYKNDERLVWNKSLTDRRGMWSDKNDPIDVVTTRVSHIIEDYEYVIDLDLG